MPTTAEWFNVYTRIAAASELQGQQLYILRAAVVDLVVPELHDQAASQLLAAQQLNILRAAVVDLVVPPLDLAAQQLNILRAAVVDLVVPPLERMAGGLGQLAIATEGEFPTLLQQIAEGLIGFGRLTEAGSTMPLAAIASALNDPDTPIGQAALRIHDLIDELLATESPGILDSLRTVLKTFGAGAEGFAKGLAFLVVAGPLLLDALKNFLPDQLTNKILDTVAVGFEGALDASRSIQHALTAPFEALVSQALVEFRTTLLAGGPADPLTAPDRAVELLGLAHRFGLQATALGAAAEIITPLKALGFKEAAAALGDLAGFKPISESVAKAFVGAAITRPMRWWGNAQFQPEIPPPRDLERMVQKRAMDLSSYNGLLQYHGFREGDRDLYEKTVWRDPTIRDLALALQDASVDFDWLLERVIRAGYSDEDAPRLATALLQRSRSGARARVISAAVAAYVDGYTIESELRTTLSDLQLPPDAVELEVRAAKLAQFDRRTDEAITTYRRQYLNGVITDNDFSLALVALGLDSQRWALILADARAQRAPRIQREEALAHQEAVTEIRRELVPRYRALFLSGQVTAQAYHDILVAAGIDEQIASQIVNLDVLRRDLA